MKKKNHNCYIPGRTNTKLTSGVQAAEVVEDEELGITAVATVEVMMGAGRQKKEEAS